MWFISHSLVWCFLLVLLLLSSLCCRASFHYFSFGSSHCVSRVPYTLVIFSLRLSYIPVSFGAVCLFLLVICSWNCLTFGCNCVRFFLPFFGWWSYLFPFLCSVVLVNFLFHSYVVVLFTVFCSPLL